MISNINENEHAEKNILSDFNAVSINIASPEAILSWSHGEVKNAETINYRSLKPEKDGLFCDRIFGPVNDYECNCGKYKGGHGSHAKGLICDRCGVELTEAKVRRERMGHIELAVPVSHIWFFKCLPSRLALILDISIKDLESVLYYEKYIVTYVSDEVKETFRDKTPRAYYEGEVIDRVEYNNRTENYSSEDFAADMGAPAIKTLLEQTDWRQKRDELAAQLKETSRRGSGRSGAPSAKQKILKRLHLIDGFLNTGTEPSWMILSRLPVLPPDLRPLVHLDGGRFAASDLNELYRRVINRNKRLKELLNQKVPAIILRNEKRMLQEAVDSLLDNGRHGKAVAGTNGRELKSFSDMLKGKQGRFRQNLLGKRVDYSGRSVIVVGPELKIHQCGLPKKMAMVLFEPFIVRHLKSRGFAVTLKAAKRKIAENAPEVWDILADVTKGHPVMLNRAPTLHRLSVQAFEPVLIEGSAIRLHPLVCTAFNADFDGDQMAVHVPLSNEAQLETKLLMLSPNNIFSPANGKPIVSPTQDMTLGCYYLTLDPVYKNGDKPKLYRDYFEVLHAMDEGYIGIHDAVRIPNPDFGKDTAYGDKESRFIETTPGRCLFNEIWDSGMGFYNRVAKKKNLGALIGESYKRVGHTETIKLLDRLKDLGYRHSTLAGMSISVTDFKVPPSKTEIIEDARVKVAEVVGQCEAGLITSGERHNKVIDIWTQASNKVAEVLSAQMEEASRRGEINPVFAMMDSGARGSKEQIRQLAGMRGLMANPSGGIIERPITANFREGLSVLEYFISTHGARKGLTDTALKTADSGYMTRRLVDVAQDIICRCEDCGTSKGIAMSAIVEGGDVLVPLRDRIIGRFAAQDVRDQAYSDGRMLVKAGEEITADIAALIEKRGIQKVMIRSTLTCEVSHGVCVKCYGRNLASDRLAKEGDALGIIAAQSIGEPGTQLTMRTFHIGGTASSAFKQPEIAAQHAGRVYYENIRTLTNENGKNVVVNKNGYIIVYDPEKVEAEKKLLSEQISGEMAAIFGAGAKNEKKYNYDASPDAILHAQLDKYEVEPGAVIDVKNGDMVKANQVFVRWDANHVPIITEESGIVKFVNLIKGVTLSEEKRGNGIVMEYMDGTRPQIVINNADGEMLNNYPLPAGAVLMVKDGDKVKPGMTIARVPRQSAKNKDITGGLPRIAELFDARQPKVVAEIAKIDGVVCLDKPKDSLTVGKSNRTKVKLIIRDKVSGSEDVHDSIPAYKHLIVSNGDFVHKGDKLTEGSVDLQNMLKVCGIHELQRHLVDAVQQVYRSQGVEINDKHIEIIIRQMVQRVRILDSGDSGYQDGDSVDRIEVERKNRKLLKSSKRPAKYEPILLGITKAALENDSFISAASFQDTTRILTEAATLGRVDCLQGFKENVITGHLIPAGTGTGKMQSLRVIQKQESLPPEELSGISADAAVDASALWIKNDDGADAIEPVFPEEGKQLENDFDLGEAVIEDIGEDLD